MTRSRIVAKRVMRVRDEFFDKFTVIAAAAIVGFLLKKKFRVVDQLHKRVIFSLSVLTEERFATVNYCLEAILTK